MLLIVLSERILTNRLKCPRSGRFLIALINLKAYLKYKNI